MTNEEAFVIIILIKFLQAFFILCVELFVMMYQQYPMTKEEDSVLMALISKVFTSIFDSFSSIDICIEFFLVMSLSM